ncbi:leucine--tRNA ligase, partial [bacterium]|nr:leucine--tRNA ligase [bacterium]
YYVLDMFPYPSGAGLHVGHVTGYTATDVIARFKRQLGFNVLHPMGWDSFGLPAEQYAIRTGTHPKITTEKSINTYRRQLKSLGFSYDWSREIATSDPTYYKWTQWIFTKLYEKGLAYEAEIMVNFCPTLGTVLANEEVENGCSKEGGYPVVKKALRQWVLKITEYAERLIEDLDELDWPDYLKRLQRNWIGKSEGLEFSFITEGNKSIDVYTTRPDTIFGVTYVVLAPEHPIVLDVTTSEYKNEILDYIQKSSLKSDLDRTELNKDKSGVFTGSYVLHPLNPEIRIPIWISDYVLYHYGTGAIMAVPAHDLRDNAFAKKYNLPIKHVIFGAENPGDCFESKTSYCINSKSETLDINNLSYENASDKVISFMEEKKIGKR